MKKEIKEFVESYNQRMEWNKEILERVNTVLYDFNSTECTRDLIDGYLSTKKITEENCELKDAQIYQLENGKLEMQAFRHSTLCSTYFYTRIGETKEEYMKTKMDAINRTIRALQCNMSKKLSKLSQDIETLSMFASYVNHKNNTEL